MLKKEQRQKIKDCLSYLLPDYPVVEVRILDSGKGVVSGYFDDLSKIPLAIKDYNGYANIYFTINPVNEALIARGQNKLIHYVKAGHTTSVKDITSIRYILVDIDAVRPEGISTTDSEKAESFKVAQEIKDFLNNKNFPKLIMADSGNSYHILVPVKLDNTEDNQRIINKFIEVLSNKFSTNKVIVDRLTNTPPILTRLYGTINCKGEDMNDRPHRHSEIIQK